MPKIRQRKLYDCLYEDDEIIEQSLRGVSVYDDSGNVIEHEAYSQDGDKTQHEHYVYSNGKMIESLLEDLLNEAIQKASFTYDGDRILSQREYFNDVDYIETRHEYDDQGRPIAIRREDNEGASQGQTLFEYQGNRTIEREYDEDGELAGILEYTTDEHGNRVEAARTEFMGKMKIITTEEAQFAGKDVLMEIRRYRDDDLVFEAENTYNERGLRTKLSITDYLNSRKTEQTFEYDEHDRVIREEFFDGEHLVQVREVQYDLHGEIVEDTYHRRLYEEHFEPVTQRFEIEYYE